YDYPLFGQLVSEDRRPSGFADDRYDVDDSYMHAVVISLADLYLRTDVHAGELQDALELQQLAASRLGIRRLRDEPDPRGAVRISGHQRGVSHPGHERTEVATEGGLHLVEGWAGNRATGAQEALQGVQAAGQALTDI